MEQPLPQCLSTNSVPRAFFPRVAIGCRSSLKIDRNLSPFWGGGLSVAGYVIWYGVNRKYGIWRRFIQICGPNDKLGCPRGNHNINTTYFCYVSQDVWENSLSVNFVNVAGFIVHLSVIIREIWTNWMRPILSGIMSFELQCNCCTVMLWARVGVPDRVHLRLFTETTLYVQIRFLTGRLCQLHARLGT